MAEEFRDPHTGIGRVTSPGGGPRRTKQAFGEDSDVNAIMRKYLATGILPHVNRAPPRYGDFTGVEDYHEALVKVRTAEQLFSELPAKVRDHCRNDPAEFLDLVFDPARRPECVELGLVDAVADQAAVAAAPAAGVASPPVAQMASSEAAPAPK